MPQSSSLDDPHSPRWSLRTTPNFRDLAGIVGDQGRRLRAHHILRSARLDSVGADDWQQLAQFGALTVCDLRSTEEVANAPSKPPEHLPVRFLQLDIRNDVRGDTDLVRDLRADPSYNGARNMMLSIYRVFPAAFATKLGQVFDSLLDPAAGPLLVHCAAGKDRTGFVVAMVLEALGVSRDAIMADYLRSPSPELAAASYAEYIQQMILQRHGIAMPVDAARPIVGVIPEYLQTAWDVVDREYDGTIAYLRQTVGLEDRALEALRGRLLG